MDVAVNFTPTGMIPTKAMTPHVPISVDEIIEQALEASEIGITTVHIHARNDDGVPTYRAETYERIIAGIRKYDKELVLCVSLSGRNFNEYEKRTEPLSLCGDSKPDMGSLTLSSTNFNRDVSLNSPDMIQALAGEMMRRGIMPELEAFDTGMINYARYLHRKGLIMPPFYFNLILGNIACAQADPLYAGLMVHELPEGSVWCIGGIGDHQLSMNAVAIASGGGVRVGIEDNIWFDAARKTKASNIALVRRIHAVAEIHGRKIMKPMELRKRLNLHGGYGRYGRNG